MWLLAISEPFGSYLSTSRYRMDCLCVHGAGRLDGGFPPLWLPTTPELSGSSLFTGGSLPPTGTQTLSCVWRVGCGPPIDKRLARFLLPASLSGGLVGFLGTISTFVHEVSGPQ